MDLLRDCLRSVRESLGKLPAEVIVVDNASADGSPEMVEREFPEAHLIRNGENRGFAAAVNQGIEPSSSPYVLLLNSDTVVLGDVLAASVEYLEGNPEVAVLGCRVLNPDGSLQRTCSRFPTLLNLFLLTSGLDRLPWPRFLGRYQMKHWQRDDVRDLDVVTGCYMMVRRAAIEAVGTLDEDFFFCGEETDWCRRFKDTGWRVRFAPVGEIIHVDQGSGAAIRPRRDLMLTSGLTRYQLKHNGRVAAGLTWCMLWLFNASRLAYWAVASRATGKEAARTRRDHFLAVVRGFREAWPRRQARRG